MNVEFHRLFDKISIRNLNLSGFLFVQALDVIIAEINFYCIKTNHTDFEIANAISLNNLKKIFYSYLECIELFLLGKIVRFFQIRVTAPFFLQIIGID